MPKTESELRRAVIDRLIAARLSESKPSKEAMLERWRNGGLAAAPSNSAQGAAIKRYPNADDQL